VLQVRHIGTGKAVLASELGCYVATSTISTPWWRQTIRASAKLLLTEEAAAEMIQAGTIRPLAPQVLVRWRDGCDAAATAKFAARRAAQKI
jgi:hypothetical protein